MKTICFYQDAGQLVSNLKSEKQRLEDALKGVQRLQTETTNDKGKTVKKTIFKAVTPLQGEAAEKARTLYQKVCEKLGKVENFPELATLEVDEQTAERITANAAKMQRDKDAAFINTMCALSVLSAFVNIKKRQGAAPLPVNLSQRFVLVVDGKSVFIPRIGGQNWAAFVAESMYSQLTTEQGIIEAFDDILEKPETANPFTLLVEDARTQAKEAKEAQKAIEAAK